MQAKEMFVVQDRTLLGAMEGHGVACVSMWDPEYRDGASIGDKAMQAASQGIATTLVITDQRWLPVFYRARIAFGGVGLIAPFDPAFERAKDKVRTLGKEPGIMGIFEGWMYLPGDTSEGAEISGSDLRSVAIAKLRSLGLPTPAAEPAKQSRKGKKGGSPLATGRTGTVRPAA